MTKRQTLIRLLKEYDNHVSLYPDPLSKLDNGAAIYNLLPHKVIEYIVQYFVHLLKNSTSYSKKQFKYFAILTSINIAL